MRALLFPGQGSQRVGMGRDLAREFAVARRVFEQADDTLGFPISKLCFDGPEADLTSTRNTQPAILVNSIAVLRTLEAERGLRFDIAAGHSLGEWSALVAAGALGFADAVRLVHLRGKAMQDAVPQGKGAMAAVIGLDPGAVREACDAVAQGEVCAPANLNGGDQVVISGAAAAVERAVAKAKELGAKRAVMLQVSAPFHCELMRPAAETLARALEPIDIGELQVPVVANVDARPNRERDRVKRLLVDQVTAPVRWEESVQALVAAGVDRAVEVGCGSVLRGLVKRIVKNLDVISVGEPHEVASVEN
jgi:[acyl-carrier-protein] S-malonyltransferase